MTDWPALLGSLAAAVMAYLWATGRLHASVAFGVLIVGPWLLHDFLKHQHTIYPGLPLPEFVEQQEDDSE